MADGELGAHCSDSSRSLPCFSVDETVLNILWDEEIQMEDLLEFSFDRIDKLAAGRGKTVTVDEKERLWDYIERMRGEKDEWITKESLPWDEINERYALRSKSLSRMSIPNLFLPEEPAPGKETKKQALCELQAGESLTQSEVWDVGSPRGHDIPAMKKASAKKEHGWKRALKNVLKDDAKKEAGILRLGGLDEFATGITMTSSPLPVPRALTADGPPPPPAATFDEERPAGLIRQSLSSFGMHSGKKDAAGPTKADNV
ncbi:uncharacterized protein LOC144097550 [Amblyomma americanum]